MRKKNFLMYYFVFLENIHWLRWIHLSISDKLFCAHTSIYIYVASYFVDCAFSKWVIINASQELHAFIQNKNILSHYSSFPIVFASFSYNMCVYST